MQIGLIDVASDLDLQRSRMTCLDEWAIWLSEGTLVKTLCSLARTAQSALNSKINSPYDPAHGAPELPEASESCPQPPCGHAWG